MSENLENYKKKEERIKQYFYEYNQSIRELILSGEDANSLLFHDFLKDLNFSIDNFAKECKNIEKSNITLEITATDEEDKTTIYKVPLSMNKSCN